MQMNHLGSLKYHRSGTMNLHLSQTNVTDPAPVTDAVDSASVSLVNVPATVCTVSNDNNWLQSHFTSYNLLRHYYVVGSNLDRKGVNA